jgi:hypothetical protein
MQMNLQKKTPLMEICHSTYCTVGIDKLVTKVLDNVRTSVFVHAFQVGTISWCSKVCTKSAVLNYM